MMADFQIKGSYKITEVGTLDIMMIVSLGGAPKSMVRLLAEGRPKLKKPF